MGGGGGTVAGCLLPGPFQVALIGTDVRALRKLVFVVLDSAAEAMAQHTVQHLTWNGALFGGVPITGCYW